MIPNIIIFTPLILLIIFQISFDSNERISVFVYALNGTGIDDFNIAATGDWGCNPETKKTVNNINAKNPELVLGLGDFSYRNDAKCWFQIIDPIYDKMKIAIGNHDAEQYFEGMIRPSPKRLEQYMSHFNLSNQYYSFDYRNVHFIAMSTETSYGVASKQFDFVKNDLKNTASNQNLKWTIIFYHRLAYSSPSNSTISLIKFREVYHPLFEKYGVDLVIQAHNHNYQRSYPIEFNHRNSSSPIISNMNTSNYHYPEGQIFITVGTAGVNQLHNLVGKAPYTVTQFKGLGFLNLDFVNNGTKLVGEFLDNNGSVKDHFSITK